MYATIAELKELLDKVSSTDDTALTICLQAAETYINGNRGARRRFDQVSEARVFDGNGVALLPVPDLVSVTSITVAPGTGQAQVALAGTDYYLGPPADGRGRPYTWIELSDVGTYRVWPRGQRTITVTGTWGWPSVPDDIQLVALSLAARAWKSTQAGFSDVIGVDEAGQAQFSKAIGTFDSQVLKSYRRTVLL